MEKNSRDLYECRVWGNQILDLRTLDLNERLEKLENSPFGKKPGLQDEDYKGLYHDLIMQVGDKHPNETRHETAKRYIRQAEEYVGDDYGDMGGKTEISMRWRGGVSI